MMKTPDEIKKGLDCCMDHDGTCEDCPYVDGECRAFEQLAEDSLALIQRLEAERDAAVKDLSECYASHCPYCKNWDKPGRAVVCINCRNGAPRCKLHFEWRGVQKEE